MPTGSLATLPSTSTARSAIFSHKEPAALRSAVRVRSPSRSQRERWGGLSATQLALLGMLFARLPRPLVLHQRRRFPQRRLDVRSWSLTLAEHPLREFFAKAGFADYPPGYFFVLWFVGHAYKLLVHSDPTYGMLKIFVKLPGIVMDFVDGLIYAIVRRFASVAMGVRAAAFFAFNPATIFISAYWGQVDSVAAGLTLGSLLLMIDSDRRTGRAATLSIVGAWLLLAYSVLIKPPAIVIAPLYFAFIFASDDSAVRIAAGDRHLARRPRGSGARVSVGVSPSSEREPVTLATWLVGRYAYASGVYAYNSVNAFNLYVMGLRQPLLAKSDGGLIPNVAGIGFPDVRVGHRPLRRRDAARDLALRPAARRRVALLEAAMILSLAYFVLSTRMHERYIFNAMMLATPLMFYRRRYLYAAIVLSLTLLGNLFYSLDYLYVMDAKIGGVDPTDLMPVAEPSGRAAQRRDVLLPRLRLLGDGRGRAAGLRSRALRSSARAQVRSWFSPLEGTAWMTARDWSIAAFLTVSSFVLTFVDYTWPSEKIFDEIYYARAGEEYLSHKEIFEFTHPPLTKLWITLSMILFGGMHGGGDTSAGWRFLNLVIGALMVLVLYCFAKRLLGSTLFATIAASLLAVRRLSLRAVAHRDARDHGRLLLAADALRVLPLLARQPGAGAAQFVLQRLGPQLGVFGGGLLVAAAFSAWVGAGQGAEAHVVAFLYLACGAYLVARLAAPRFLGLPPVTSYAEGTRVVGGALLTLDGGRVPLGNGAIAAGDATEVQKNLLVHQGEGVHIEYGRNGNAVYATNGGGEAAFTPDGKMKIGAATIDGARDGVIWLWVLAACAGALGREQVERSVRFLRDLVRRARRRAAAQLGAAATRGRADERARRAGDVGQSVRHLVRHPGRGDAVRGRHDLHALLHPVFFARTQPDRSGRPAAADVRLPLRPQSNPPVRFEVVAVALHRAPDLVLLSRLACRRPDAEPAGVLRRRDHRAAESRGLVARFGVGSRHRLARRARAQQGLLVARDGLSSAVAALDDVAARRVRVSLLSEPGDHLSRRHGAAAAPVALRRTASWRARVYSHPDGACARPGRSCRRGGVAAGAGGRAVRVLLSGAGRAARAVARLGRPHVARDHAERLDLGGVACRVIPNGTTSS
jgi:Gpi18-like mannosyltransferase